MHPRRIPGSDVNLGLAAAFVVALAALLYTDPADSHPARWQEARPEVHQEQGPVEVGAPMVEALIREVECDRAVS